MVSKRTKIQQRRTQLHLRALKASDSYVAAACGDQFDGDARVIRTAYLLGYKNGWRGHIKELAKRRRKTT